MRQEIKVNLGNFSNVTFVSSEYDTKEECRADLKSQLEDWIGVSGEAEQFNKIYFKGEVASPMIEAEELPMTEEIKKQKPTKKKGSKKIELGVVYKIVKDPCNKCKGLISWDDYNIDTHRWPTHVDKNGQIIGDGSCPESDF